MEPELQKHRKTLVIISAMTFAQNVRIGNSIGVNAMLDVYWRLSPFEASAEP
ncbi:hypothetical protein BELL_0451g00090 [Botrytis elliptica]|uniref:Uncharacterized protein n=1 Tax=Botrytis elliptica TaxID=278938 RepID=A0A4Z1JFL0_9HELO|nr:hypothetical protein BELL_0451g00090 [Botrytis elliptica]